MNKYEAQNNYWNSFGLMAFNEETVPDLVPKNGELVPLEMPYITYEPVDGSLDGVMQQSASLWYRGNSWVEIINKTGEIEAACNRQVKINGGYMKVRKPQENFAQPMGDPNDKQIRRMVIHVLVEFIVG